MSSVFFFVVLLFLFTFRSCPNYISFSFSCLLSSLFAFMSLSFPFCLLSSLFVLSLPPLIIHLTLLAPLSFHSFMSSSFFFVVFLSLFSFRSFPSIFYFLFLVFSLLCSLSCILYFPFLLLSSVLFLSLPPLIIHLALLVPLVFQSLMSSLLCFVVLLSLSSIRSCPNHD